MDSLAMILLDNTHFFPSDYHFRFRCYLVWYHSCKSHRDRPYYTTCWLECIYHEGRHQRHPYGYDFQGIIPFLITDIVHVGLLISSSADNSVFT